MLQANFNYKTEIKPTCPAYFKVYIYVKSIEPVYI